MSGEENIYMNPYPATREFGWRVKYIFLKWKGSVFRLMCKELAIYMSLYFFISMTYRLLLAQYPTAKHNFELFCVHCSYHTHPTAVAILTGFYVSNVVHRYWEQFMAIPWPDQLALKLVAFIPCEARDSEEKKDFKRRLRRAVIRYVNLSTILVLRRISQNVHEKYPDFSKLCQEKLLLPNELARLESIDEKSEQESTWVPLLWAMKLISKARKERDITIEGPVFSHLQAAFDRIENCNRKLLCYGWKHFPLAYTQVATLIAMTYFTAQLFAKQFFVPSDTTQNATVFVNTTLHYSSVKPFDKHTPDLYFPLFLFVEFFCIMGWIKVAENLLNPFGDDAEDFNVDHIINRNLQVSYLIVDQAEKDMEVSKDGIPNDPFLDAEIDIPSPLSPIVNKGPSFKRARNEESLKEETLEETSIPQDTSSVVLRSMKPLNTSEVIVKDLEDRNSRDERIGLSCIPETEIV